MNFRINLFVLLFAIFIDVSFAFVGHQQLPSSLITTTNFVPTNNKQHERYAQLLYSTPNENDTSSSAAEGTVAKKEVACPNCDLCDGSGRIPGGIGAIFPWIPIKAYRPCPNFINRGGYYERAGQGLDEIAFGRDSTFTRK